MFTSIDLIVSFIREGSYVMLANEEKEYIHNNLMDWLCKKSPEEVSAIPPYLKIKYSVLVALLIKMDYPSFWPNVFEVRLFYQKFTVDASLHSNPFSIPLIYVPQNHILCGRGNRPRRGRHACPYRPSKSGSGNPRKRHASRQLHRDSFPIMVADKRVFYTQDRGASAVQHPERQSERRAVQCVSGDSFGVLGLDRYFVYGQSGDAADAVYAGEIACVCGEDAADVRRAHWEGNERTGQDFADSIAYDQYPLRCCALDPSRHPIY